MDSTSVPAGTVVVGIDGSASADRALRWAIDEAVGLGRPLTLLHAVATADAAWLPRTGLDYGPFLAELRERGRDVLTRAREAVAQRAPGLEVHEVLEVADPRSVLVDVSRDASLLVLGSRGRGPVRSLLLGSVGLAVMRHAHCPVVIHRSGKAGLVRHGVLVGIDGGDHSRAVLEFGFAQASRRELPLTVVHTDEVVGYTAPDEQQQQLLVSEAAAGLREKYPDVRVTVEVAVGAPEAHLLRLGARMDLVVVGAHVGGIGSVAASVVEHATSPVAVVPQ